MTRAMSTRAKALWSIFLLWHGLVVLGSVMSKTPLGETIRLVTKPYEKFLGVHQTWTMFAPNAPRESTWVEAIGVTTSGEKIPVGTFTGEPVLDELRLVYNRMGKFERNISKKKKGSLRRGYARGLCRLARADGIEDLDGISFVFFRSATVPPSRRAAEPRDTWPVDRHDYAVRSCE